MGLRDADGIGESDIEKDELPVRLFDSLRACALRLPVKENDFSFEFVCDTETEDVTDEDHETVCSLLNVFLVLEKVTEALRDADTLFELLSSPVSLAL